MVPLATPFYYSHHPDLFSFISDQHLTVAAPVIAYWGLSLLFHHFDVAQYKWMEKYRIHESAEVTSRNLVTRWQVVKAVVFQQIIQTILGLLWVDSVPSAIDHGLQMKRIGNTIQSIVTSMVDEGVAKNVLKSFGPDCVYFIYWWGIPILQFLAAIFFIDTWQYFLHRSMHMNKFLYKHVHSWHHRLYVPYAFGSLYNHPIEGFLLDTLGAALAEALTFMSVRQAMFLFTVSTFKTVDDHCGYKLPFDPLQLITSNNADYHDIHHQIIGIKSNFAQPFFIHWDDWLGTRMTREDIKNRKAKSS
jgi:sphinganine C4-monooxygenase